MTDTYLCPACLGTGEDRDAPWGYSCPFCAGMGEIDPSNDWEMPLGGRYGSDRWFAADEPDPADQEADDPYIDYDADGENVDPDLDFDDSGDEP